MMSKLEEILQSEEIISAADVRQLMKCTDITVQHRLWLDILMSSDMLDKICPPLPQDEVDRFYRSYLGRCLNENPSRRAAYDREQAADEILRVFWDSEEDTDILQEKIAQTKLWLEDLYVTSKEPVQIAIESKVLARLFEYELWRNYFSDWILSNKLIEVYKRAAKKGYERSREETITDIIRTAESSELIPLIMARNWMLDESVEVKSTFHSYILCNDEAIARIDPPLGPNETSEFIFGYFKQCVLENPLTKYGLSRYDAAHEIMGWFLHRDYDDIKLAEKAKAFLAELYHEGDTEAREAIVYGCLRYVLSKKRWCQFFADWEDNPILVDAYEQGLNNRFPCFGTDK